MRNQVSFLSLKLVKGCAIVAGLTTTLSAFAQTPAADAPAFIAAMQSLIQSVSQAEQAQDGMLKDFGVSFNASDLHICRGTISPEDENLTPPSFSPRLAGDNQCSAENVTALTAAIPANQCTVIAVQGVFARGISPTILAGSLSVETRTQGNKFMSLICNETAQSVDLNFGAFAVGGTQVVSAVRINMPGSITLARLRSHVNNIVNLPAGQRMPRRYSNGSLAVTSAQLQGFQFGNANICNVEFPSVVSDEDHVGDYASLTTPTNRITTRSEGENQCSNPSAITAPLNNGQCALIVAQAFNTNAEISDIDLAARISGATSNADENGDLDNHPAIVVCNNTATDAAPHPMSFDLLGRQVRSANGAALITRIDFQAAVGVNLPLPPETQASAAQNLVAAMTRVQQQAATETTPPTPRNDGSTYIGPEGQAGSDRAARRANLNRIHFEGIDFSSRPVCLVNFRRSENLTQLPVTVAARPGSEGPNACTTSQQIASLTAPLENNRCMVVAIHNLVQDESSDIDTSLRMYTSAARSTIAPGINGASDALYDNSPIMRVCNTSGRTVYPGLFGVQGRGTVNTDATILRFDYDVPADQRNSGNGGATGTTTTVVPTPAPATRPANPTPRPQPQRSVLAP